MTSPAAVLIERVARVPAVELPAPPEVEAALQASVEYLGSGAAQRSLEVDPYWPKWGSPWWHFLLCLELGEVRRVPERAARALLAALQAFPVKIFPLTPEELPPGASVESHTLCHCQLASALQMLRGWGVDVERELPWAAPWFVRYQMADGGLNCDSDAYLVPDECPSSMVGTISPLEAMLQGELTGERLVFVDRAAGSLLARRLTLGSATRHNAVERERAPAWLAPCFPRFYFYDVLRGLGAVTRWAERREQPLPLAAIAPVVEHLLRSFPDGVVQVGRFAREGIGTRALDASGAWVRQPAARFALLDATSRVGAPSPALTREWRDLRRRLLALHDAGRLAS